MILIPELLIDTLIQEDLPYFDLTTHALGMGNVLGQILFSSVTQTRLCCTEEAGSILKRLGAEVTLMLPTGENIEPGTPFLRAEGTASALHQGWKVAQNLLEYACGVATATAQLVQLATTVNPDIMLYTTRKSIPGTKPIAVKAILAGGAYPHRLGLSETVLIFAQHLNFIGGAEGLIAQMSTLKRKVKEKKVLVEVKASDQAIPFVRAGVDGIQFDKVNAPELAEIIPHLKSIRSDILTLAAGGINQTNITEYAKTGVDGLVLTAPYYAKPADIRVEIMPLGRD